MWPEILRAIHEAIEDLRLLGRTCVPRHLAPWVRQSAEARGMRVQTTPMWGGDVRIEVVGVSADGASGRG